MVILYTWDSCAKLCYSRSKNGVPPPPVWSWHQKCITSCKIPVYTWQKKCTLLPLWSKCHYAPEEKYLQEQSQECKRWITIHILGCSLSPIDKEGSMIFWPPVMVEQVQNVCKVKENVIWWHKVGCYSGDQSSELSYFIWVAWVMYLSNASSFTPWGFTGSMGRVTWFEPCEPYMSSLYWIYLLICSPPPLSKKKKQACCISIWSMS